MNKSASGSPSHAAGDRGKKAGFDSRTGEVSGSGSGIGNPDNEEDYDDDVGTGSGSPNKAGGASNAA